MNLEKMLGDFFEQDSLDKLTADAGELLGCPLLVVDDTFHIVSSCKPSGFCDRVFDNAVTRGEITYEVVSMLSSRADKTEPLYVAIQDSAIMRLFIPLVSGGLLVGYLVCLDVHADLRKTAEGMLHWIKNILAKQLYAEATRGGSMLSTAEEVLTHLLDGKFSSKAFFYVQASTTYLADYTPKRFALIYLGRYHRMTFGDDALKNELNYAFYASHPFLYNGHVLLFLTHEHDVSAFDALAKRFQLCVVISDELQELYSLPERYQAVREIMEYLLLHTSGSFVAQADQFHTLMLLRRLQDRPDLIAPQVQALADYDRRYHTQYCLTLYTYFICHHSVQSTCERLFTHRNTVLYRLRKLREEFGLELDDPEQTLALLLSVSIVLLRGHQDQLFVQGFTLDTAAPPAGDSPDHTR